MPCTECGESAREKHGGVVGGNLRYDEDGVARYICLDCLIEMFKYP